VLCATYHCNTFSRSGDTNIREKSTHPEALKAVDRKDRFDCLHKAGDEWTVTDNQPLVTIPNLYKVGGYLVVFSFEVL
jgi:hypothetical protein